MTTLVQQQSDSGSSVASKTVTLDQASVAGNALILVANITGATTITSVASTGATWELAIRSVLTGTFFTTIETWIAPNAPSDTTIEITLSGTADLGVNVHERTGLRSQTPVHTTVEDIDETDDTTLGAGVYDPDGSYMLLSNMSGPFEMAPPIDSTPEGWNTLDFYEGTRIGIGAWLDVTAADGPQEAITIWTNAQPHLGNTTVFLLDQEEVPAQVGQYVTARHGEGAGW